MAAPDPAFWAGRRVLVTGHTGFKGAWLCLWLHALGAEVTGVSDRVPTDPSLFALARVGELVDDRRADVRDAEALAETVAAARPEVVLHLAAQSLVRRSYAEPAATVATNVMGTVNLFEAVRAAGGVRALVNVTSDKCYANREWEWGYREDDPLGGADPYAASKGAAELLTDAWRRSFGLPVVSARAGNVIGGGDWAADRLVPDVVRALAAGEPVVVRNPDAVRPWQHVLEPLSGYLALAEAAWTDPERVPACNFGPAEADARPVRRLADRLCALWPGEARWVHDEAGGAGSPAAPHEAGQLKLDSSRARVRLGWAPRWDLDTALRAVVDWHVGAAEGKDVRDVTIEQIASFQASSG